eukprot:421590-Amphidinium_carterae.1
MSYFAHHVVGARKGQRPTHTQRSDGSGNHSDDVQHNARPNPPAAVRLPEDSKMGSTVINHYYGWRQ